MATTLETEISSRAVQTQNNKIEGSLAILKESSEVIDQNDRQDAR